MDTREWFDEAAYSDLTIKLSDGAEIKVQKIIVCRANAYFRKLCGPESQFAESNQKTIELKDDDPTALRNVLRSIYKLPVVKDFGDKEEWQFWLNLHKTADKYLELWLSFQARRGFRHVASAEKDCDTIFDIIEAINDDMAHDEKLVEFGEQLRKDNLGSLLKNDRFRAQLDSGGKEALWQQLDELAFAADLVKKCYFLCDSHASDTFQEPSISTDEEILSSCTICQVRTRKSGVGHHYDDSGCTYERTAWIPK